MRGAAPSQAALLALRREIEDDIRRIEGENSEMDMLMEQVLTEIERHEGRRGKSEARLASLEASAAPDPAELAEARESLLAMTRREMLFDAQRQVLEGKQRVLARFLQRLAEIDNSLAAMGGGATRPAPIASAGLRPLADAAGGSGAPGFNQPTTAMRGEEELRKEIVRQLHDGPAQSIANIGMQAEIVERLVQKGDARAAEEVESLRRMVQAALAATKDFIFEVRPMVLDDLGLGPTVRRFAHDRGQRAGIHIEFDSHGVEARLDSDVESAVYRSIVEAIAGYIGLKPPSVLVRLDWGERELVVTVEGTWPRISPDGEVEPGGTAASRSVETPPALLAMMEEHRSAEREADLATRALPAALVDTIDRRSRALGVKLSMRDEGQVVELVAPIAR
ncbi:MAG: histidine kinase [Candidatus Limnocylindrales bacterium]